MNRKLEAAYTLRAADFDTYSRLRPAAIMDLFQDVAGRHANILGCGGADLIGQNMVWVIVKLRLRILRQAAMYQPVTVSTWPLPPGRIGYQREYRISSLQGETIAEGSSEWVLMDISSRRIVSVGNVYPLTEHCTEQVFASRFPRLRSFEAEGEVYSCLPPFSDFDLNGHVNNTKYANYVLDALCPRRSDVITGFQMEYHREVLPGTPLTVLTRREENSVLARGENPEGEKMFSCCVEFAEKE